MSATLNPAAAAGPRLRRALAAADARSVGDGLVVAALGAMFAVIVVLTWRKWGMPEGDAGADLTAADLIKHGAVAYRDVRYFYGPLGLYSLAFAFRVLGTSFTTAYAFGLAQAAAILGVFYALARQWLAPVQAGLTTAVLLAIGFSGTSFNFVLPHTNSATFGLLTLLLMLLALRRGWLVTAGIALGLNALTRPEFLVVAGGAAVAYLLAAWRIEGWATTQRALYRIVPPAVVIPILVYGYFAAKAGASNVFFQNLWPTHFLHVAGFRMQQGWTPLDVPSFFGLIARGALYLGLIGAVMLSTELWLRSTGRRRLLAVWPLVAWVIVFALADGALRATGLFAAQRAAIDYEVRHLILGMSWLPALAIGAFAWAALRLARRGDSILGGGWAADFALIVASVGLGLRAYNAFTAEGSYAPYYAAPLVLLLGIFHARLAERRPQVRFPMLGVLGLVAVGLAAYAVVGLYRHVNTEVHTPRGTFVTTATAAPAIQSLVNAIDARTKPGDRILVAPVDGGIYFFSDRRPGIYELTLLPGLLYGRSDQDKAIVRLRAQHVRLAVLASRDNTLWRMGDFGTGYDQVVGNYLRSAALQNTTVGSLHDPAAGTFPSHGFTLLQLAG